MELNTDLMTAEQVKEKLMKFQKETLAEALYDFTRALGGEIQWEYLKAINESLLINRKVQKSLNILHLMEQLETDLPRVEEAKILTALDKMLPKRRKSKNGKKHGRNQ